MVVLRVLVCGLAGSGKRTLIEGITHLRTSDIVWDIHTRERLDEGRLKDFHIIVVMTSLTHMGAASYFEDALSTIPPEFLLGRCMFVATHADAKSDWCILPSSVSLLLDQFDLIPSIVDLQDSIELSNISSQICSLALASSGIHSTQITLNLPHSIGPAGEYRQPFSASFLTTMDPARVPETKE
eukprot:TRINITY_DN77840_c0_g1_i1.p1 TRINITY_DN77840_c0_g1~~TRINITY_DN77840_c0_g1_i1.p1  ORF type:complete len:191 (-),score=43.34 TRINITY_DN77840_c0_g1_i1:155-706(-)